MATKSGLNGASSWLRVLLTAGSLALIASWSPEAHAKKAHKLKMDPAVPNAPEPTGPVPPEADANGHVNFGNPQADGLGRVTVTSPSGEKIQVYLEGRYFGDTPVTIYSVPKGDYIVEGTVISSGKQLSRPVSVTENEEATVDMGAARVETAGSGDSGVGGEMTPQRLRLAKIFAVVGGVGIIMGVTFAILESGAESDYEKAPAGNQANVDSIASSGRRDALLANVGFVLAGVGIAGAIITGYPLVTKSGSEKQATTAFVVAPLLAPGTAGGALSLRF